MVFNLIGGSIKHLCYIGGHNIPGGGEFCSQHETIEL